MLLLCLFSGFIATFALLKLQKHGKQGNFHVFGKMLHKKQADFLCVLTVGLSRAAPIHYIYNAPRVLRLSCPAPLLKNVISLAPIISISNNTLFVKFYALHKKFQQDDEWNVPYVWNVLHVPNVPNIPDNPDARFFAVVPIFPRQKVDHRRLYSASEKLNAIAYIAPAEE